MSNSPSINGNAALAVEPSLNDLELPKTQREISGSGKLTIGGVTSSIAYNLRAIAEGVTEVAIQIGEEIGSTFKAIVKHPVAAAAGATLGLAAVPGAQSEGLGAIMLDGTTRAQMTADNSTLDGFYASATTYVGGDASPNNSTLTHLWGQYYVGAAHEDQNGLALGSINRDRNYRADGGHFSGINAVAFSPNADLMIVTADTADNTSRDPNSKIAGIAVAVTSSSTIYVNLSSPQNLSFINQITGGNITEEQILAGQSVIAAPKIGDHIWSEGYGAWGTPSTGVSNPDGLPGQWQGAYIPNGGGLNGTYNDPTLYFSTSFVNDGGLTNGPLNGVGKSIDSGSVGIISVPEPMSSELLIIGLASYAAVARSRRTV